MKIIIEEVRCLACGKKVPIGKSHKCREPIFSKAAIVLVK